MNGWNPKITPLEEETHLLNHPFQVRFVNLSGWNSILQSIRMVLWSLCSSRGRVYTFWLWLPTKFYPVILLSLKMMPFLFGCVKRWKMWCQNGSQMKDLVNGSMNMLMLYADQSWSWLNSPIFIKPLGLYFANCVLHFCPTLECRCWKWTKTEHEEFWICTKPPWNASLGPTFLHRIPPRELTYPPRMAFWRWFFFSQGGIC